MASVSGLTRPVEPPNGGYGWVIVVASLMLGITVGAKYVSFGVFLIEFCHFLDMPQANVSLINAAGNIAFTIFCKFGPSVSSDSALTYEML